VRRTTEDTKFSAFSAVSAVKVFNRRAGAGFAEFAEKIWFFPNLVQESNPKDCFALTYSCACCYMIGLAQKGASGPREGQKSTLGCDNFIYELTFCP
jgi:hypothetical protein